MVKRPGDLDNGCETASCPRVTNVGLHGANIKWPVMRSIKTESAPNGTGFREVSSFCSCSMRLYIARFEWV